MDNDVFTAIIAASSALLGVVAAQVAAIAHARAERKHQQAVFLRGKYEELVSLLNKVLMLTLGQVGADREQLLGAPCATEHLRTMYGLCLIYFQPLKSLTFGYLEASLAFEFALAEESSKGGPSSVKQRQAASAALLAARNALEHEIAKHAQKYAGS